LNGDILQTYLSNDPRMKSSRTNAMHHTVKMTSN